jgi:hypothetical protein
MGSRAVSHACSVPTERSKAGPWTSAQRGGFQMEAPLNIAQFNALLHTKRDQSELMSALRELRSVDIAAFVEPVRMFLSYW